MKPIMAEVAGVRRTGSAALDLAWTRPGALMPTGSAELKPWDMAAGIVLMREAGGTVCDLSGGADMLDKDEILAANTVLQKPLLELMAKPAAKV